LEILANRNSRLEYEKTGSNDTENAATRIVVQNIFYAGWILVGIAITSSSRNRAARSHLFASLALLALVETKILTDLVYTDLLSTIPFTVFDLLKLLRALFSVPVLLLLYVYDSNNQEEILEREFKINLLKQQHEINT
jgi:hypothetical protein